MSHRHAKSLSTRVLLILAALLLPPSLLSAQRVTVEFWHAMGGQHGRTVSEIVQRFNESQDEFQVDAIYQGRYASLSQKLIASLYARRNPAISQMYPGWATRFYRYGYLEPIENFLDRDEEFRNQTLTDFFPVMIEENTLPHPETGLPKVITLPFNKSVYMLFVNQTRMAELGWTEPPRTWAELLRLAREMTITPDGASRPTFYGFASRPFIEDLTVQAFSAGTRLFDEETERPLLDTPEALEAFEFLRTLVAGEGERRVGYVESDYLSNAFGSEQVGMFVSSTASFPYNDQAVGNKFVWMAYRVPARDEETEARTLMQGSNIGVFSRISDEEKRGAWAFLKFLTSPEITAYWAMETGYMPVRRSTKQVPEFAEFLERNDRYRNAVATLEQADYEPRRMYWETVRTIITREVESVLLGRRSIPQAVDFATRTINETIERADR